MGSNKIVGHLYAAFIESGFESRGGTLFSFVNACEIHVTEIPMRWVTNYKTVSILSSFGTWKLSSGGWFGDHFQHI